MDGNLNFGAHQLHFDVGGEHGFHLHKDPQALYIRDHDGHVLMTFGYGRIPTVYGNATIATATKPAVYDFPFVAGITSMQKSIYWKTQDGEVTVILNCSSAVNITNGMSIGTLPEGYRPNWALSTLCNLTFSDNSRALVGVTVAVSGSVNLWSSLIGGQKSAMYMDFAPIRFVAA